MPLEFRVSLYYPVVKYLVRALPEPPFIILIWGKNNPQTRIYVQNDCDRPSECFPYAMSARFQYDPLCSKLFEPIQSRRLVTTSFILEPSVLLLVKISLIHLSPLFCDLSRQTV